MRQQEICSSIFPARLQNGFRAACRNMRLQCVKGQSGHIDNRDPIELLGRDRGKRMVWEATDARKARSGEGVTVPHGEEALLRVRLFGRCFAWPGEP